MDEEHRPETGQGAQVSERTGRLVRPEDEHDSPATRLPPEELPDDDVLRF